MAFTAQTITALVIGISFAAGLNLYATVLALGILSRLHRIDLPPGLEMLASWWALGAAGVMFSAEFVADKIPGFDLIWNAAHTFIRVPVAALIAYRAAMHQSPEMQIVITIVGGLLALAAHSSKTGIRALVTPSPEPVSNIALSSAEDIVAIALTWVTTHHPMIGVWVVVLFLVAGVLTARWSIKAIKRMFRGNRQISLKSL